MVKRLAEDAVQVSLIFKGFLIGLSIAAPVGTLNLALQRKLKSFDESASQKHLTPNYNCMFFALRERLRTKTRVTPMGEREIVINWHWRDKIADRYDENVCRVMRSTDVLFIEERSLGYKGIT